MPFQSKVQARAAFGGYLGSEMKAKAAEWAQKTPSMKALPTRVGEIKNKVHDVMMQAEATRRMAFGKRKQK